MADMVVGRWRRWRRRGGSSPALLAIKQHKPQSPIQEKGAEKINEATQGKVCQRDCSEISDVYPGLSSVCLTPYGKEHDGQRSCSACWFSLHRRVIRCKLRSRPGAGAALPGITTLNSESGNRSCTGGGAFPLSQARRAARWHGRRRLWR